VDEGIREPERGCGGKNQTPKDLREGLKKFRKGEQYEKRNYHRRNDRDQRSRIRGIIGTPVLQVRGVQNTLRTEKAPGTIKPTGGGAHKKAAPIHEEALKSATLFNRHRGGRETEKKRSKTEFS